MRVAEVILRLALQDDIDPEKDEEQKDEALDREDERYESEPLEEPVEDPGTLDADTDPGRLATRETRGEAMEVGASRPRKQPLTSSC